MVGLANFKSSFTTVLKTHALAGLVALAAFSPLSSNAAVRCSDLLSQQAQDYSAFNQKLFGAFPTDAESLKTIEIEEKNSAIISNSLMSEMRKVSDHLKVSLKTSNTEQNYDLVCVGAGAQCAAASLMAKELKLKALVIEKSNLVARNFAEKDFKINSTETDRTSMHPIFGSSFDLSQITSQRYASSAQLATKIQADQYTSNVPVLLNSSVSETHAMANGRVAVKLADGTLLSAQNVILATGLGRASTKVANPEYRKLFDEMARQHEAQPAQILPVMSTDAVLVAIKTMTSQKMGIHLPRDIVIVGNGDGSKIVLEALSHLSLPSDTRIKWIGNDYQTAHDYLHSVEGWDRYVQMVVPHFEAGRLSGVDARVEAINYPDIKVKMKPNATATQATISGHLIIDATGYENVNLEIIDSMAKMIDVRGQVAANTNETVIGRQFTISGITVPIFAAGASAGFLATEAEMADLRNKNPVSIYNTARRTSALVRQIFDANPINEDNDGTRRQRLSVMTPDQALVYLQTERAR
jgi:hypothetical protein